MGLLAECAIFQRELLSLEEPILVRGAIVEGKVYAEGDVTFGPGLTDAYLMEEMNAKFPRIILLEDTYINGKESCTADGRKGIDFLVKRDFDAYYIVNYCKMFCDMDVAKKQEKAVRKYIHNILSKEKDSSVREKILYLEHGINEYSGE